MSYILDALKKADAERGLGQVPGLHSQPAPTVAGDAPDVAPSPSLVWPITLVLCAALGVTAVWFWGPGSAPSVTVAPPPASAVIVEPAGVNHAAANLAPPPEAARTTVTGPTERLPRRVVESAPAVVPVVAPKPTPVAARSASPVPSPSPSPTSAAAPAAISRVYAVDELPEDVRRALPPIAIGGSMYSDNPADRMLIINGKLYHEGDELVTGVVLEQMMAKAVVLKFRGYRYRLAY